MDRYRVASCYKSDIRARTVMSNQKTCLSVRPQTWLLLDCCTNYLCDF